MLYYYLFIIIDISFSLRNPDWLLPPLTPPTLIFPCLSLWLSAAQDIEDLDHYEMKEEEPVDGKKSEDDGIEKENLAILEKIRKNQRQDHLNVSAHSVRQPFSTFSGLGSGLKKKMFKCS